MEKLIELLKEYNDNKEGVRIGFITTVHIDGVPTPYELGKSDLLRYEDKIISKKYGFIKWLVENDKIDREKFGNYETKSSKYSDFELSYNTPREDYTNTLLMELAIQEEPIQFLVEMLK